MVKRMIDGVYVVKEASMSKLISTKMADKVIYDCLQLLGGYGYMKEYKIERFARDAKLLEIGAGTTEIRKLIIARELLKSKQ